MEIRDLRKSFGNVDVIQGVSIDIRDGEFVVWSGRRAAENRRCCV